jgi:hypothetical protein
MATVGAAPPAEESPTTITPEIIQKVCARVQLLAMWQRAGRTTHRATEPPPAWCHRWSPRHERLGFCAAPCTVAAPPPLQRAPVHAVVRLYTAGMRRVVERALSPRTAVVG